MRSVARFHASEAAFQRLISELVDKRAISLEVAQILANFHDYQEEALSDALLKLEVIDPSFAAELDRGRDEPTVGGESHDEDSKS